MTAPIVTHFVRYNVPPHQAREVATDPTWKLSAQVAIAHRDWPDPPKGQLYERLAEHGLPDVHGPLYTARLWKAVGAAYYQRNARRAAERLIAERKAFEREVGGL